MYLLCIWQLTVFTCLCHLRLCAYVTRGYAGTPPVPTYYIHSLLHRLGVHTVNHYQLLVVNSCMTHGYGCLHVLGTGDASYWNLTNTLSASPCNSGVCSLPSNADCSLTLDETKLSISPRLIKLSLFKSASPPKPFKR